MKARHIHGGGPGYGLSAAGLLAALLVTIGCKEGPHSAASVSSLPPELRLVPLTNMIQLKPGSFVRMRQPVTISGSFWLGKYEVTQGEYTALMGRNPSHFIGNSNRPVEKLSQFDAQAFCAKLSARERDAGRLPTGYEYRLPTEAEWEYACRAGTTNLFSFGDDPGVAERFAWTMENSDSSTHPVGLKEPNPWGFCDMHGNVWEWCLDWFQHPFPQTGATNPAGPASGKLKVFRGGGWNQEVKFAGSGNRFMMSPSNGIYFVGFRVALGPPVGPAVR